MPNRARKEAPADNSTHRSAQKQCSRRRRQANTTNKRKQITLTQFERGPPFQGVTIGDSEDEDEDSPPKKKTKTRRSKLPGKTESQNTLTQIGWISTIPPSDSEENEEQNELSPDEDGSVVDSDEEFAGFSDADEIVPGHEETEQHIKQEASQDEPDDMRSQLTPDTSQPHQSPVRTRQEPPQTPQRMRRLEIPSSQSPLITPLSAIHTHERINLRRSPLQPLSANPHTLLDTPSRTPKDHDVPTSPSARSARKRVAIKEQPFSSASRPTQRQSHSPGRFEIDDSEEEEDEDEDVTEAVAGIDIGQETQAYIRRIDFVHASAQGTAEPGPSGYTDNEEDDSGLPQNPSNMSFNFDEEPLREPGDSPQRETDEEITDPDGTPRAIKREPQTQQPWHSSPAHQRTLPSNPASPTNTHLSSPLRPSQISTVAGTTQASPPPSSSHIPSSQRPQNLPQSPPHPSQVSTVAGTPQQHRIPDSQPQPTSSPVVADGRGRRGREVRGAQLVTATQMLAGGGAQADYSLPPPPPWTQDTEDEEGE